MLRWVTNDDDVSVFVVKCMSSSMVEDQAFERESKFLSAHGRFFMEGIFISRQATKNDIHISHCDHA